MTACVTACETMQNTVSSNNDEAIASQKAVTSAAVAATCAEVAANSANSEVIAASSEVIAASSAAVALNLALNDRYPKEQNDHESSNALWVLSLLTLHIHATALCNEVLPRDKCTPPGARISLTGYPQISYRCWQGVPTSWNV
ncbi:hypothetical protein FRACYDRAFT_254687 [Fragilariopsis cylindrus CCMP1102]|uniref:Uncharacterized protein n=1 Tax=Fragilariopsis cylindrus CCMP1102 TaxID=635003 RepID=A0A1E7EKI2_9STRA|nr:hypothetical protein FRACYDRAFT_254687 [Fragilariopsis cylindrus CCMP1102]|eukprot:OEU06388.1 hypothetical protein FRACYDRAFT_254687 [Fragilariopsis cylindrus CCMP1102]